jgi:hypothetical protein
MKAHTVAYVVPMFVAPIQSMLHQDNIGITYAGNSNFKMEPITSMLLCSMVMP